jgi:hypothetical protein
MLSLFPFPERVGGRLAAALAFVLAGLITAPAAIDTSYAVQASATAQSSPAQITLSWTPGPGATNGYALSRKEAGAGAWTPLINLTGGITTYTDTNVTAGRIYEYQVVRQSANLTGYGYVAAGVDVPVVDFRGKVILVVDNAVAGALAAEIDQLVRNLIGDGWTVARRDVGRGDSPVAVRDAIRGAYNEDSANARAVLLLGRVPVAKSGNLNVDGHAARPLPADVFYGDMNGNWTDANGDGILDQDRIPSDVELMVGRVDFADMGSFGSEIDLLRRYLNKNHEFRHALRRITPRALVGDRFGDIGGEAFGASGFRNFSALLGPGRTTAANVEDNSPAGERWISRLTAQDWLWVYGAGGGDVTAISGLGMRGPFNDVTSADLVNQRARGTFYLLFGSWLVDWSQPDNIMRAALAAPDHGLTAAWSGRPHLFFQHMAVGETAGHGIRLSQNNSSLYTNQVNRETRGIHIALLGDPTLRMQVVAPASNLRIAGGGGSPALTWNASTDADAGYHVYRATSDAGPFTRVSGSPVNVTSYTDFTAPAGSFTYMVRAVRREISGGGSYFNQSQGIFAQATVTSPSTNPPPNPDSTPPPGGGSGDAGAGGGSTSPWMLGSLALLLLLRGRRGNL